MSHSQGNVLPISSLLDNKDGIPSGNATTSDYSLTSYLQKKDQTDVIEIKENEKTHTVHNLVSLFQTSIDVSPEPVADRNSLDLQKISSNFNTRIGSSDIKILNPIDNLAQKTNSIITSGLPTLSLKNAISNNTSTIANHETKPSMVSEFVKKYQTNVMFPPTTTVSESRTSINSIINLDPSDEPVKLEKQKKKVSRKKKSEPDTTPATKKLKSSSLADVIGLLNTSDKEGLNSPSKTDTDKRKKQNKKGSETNQNETKKLIKPKKNTPDVSTDTKKNQVEIIPKPVISASMSADKNPTSSLETINLPPSSIIHIVEKPSQAGHINNEVNSLEKGLKNTAKDTQSEVPNGNDNEKEKDKIERHKKILKDKENDKEKDKEKEKVEPPIIALNIPLLDPNNPKPGQAEVVINVLKLAEDKYGWSRIHPQAKSAIDIMDDMIEDDEDVMDEDEDDEVLDDEKISKKKKEEEELTEEQLARRHEVKMNRKVGKYDYEDPFIDDIELQMEEEITSTKEGFFVYWGPLVDDRNQSNSTNKKGTAKSKK